jgi:glycosyltransferase involved in cell wall biosynthesis
MRVLILAQFYPPIVGGEEHVVEALGIELSRRGHQVAVATIQHPGLPGREEVEGVRVHRLRSAASTMRFLYSDERLHAPPGPDPALTWQLRRVLDAERPDIVHAHNWIVHSYLPLKRLAGVPLILSLHDYSLVCSMKRLMRHGTPCSGPGIVKCLRCAGDHYGAIKGAGVAAMVGATAWPEAALIDRYVPVSQAVARLNRLHLRRTPYEVIPNFFSPPRAAQPPWTDQLPEGEFVLYAGDVSYEKGADALLRAFARAEQPTMPLVMIGRQFLEPAPEGTPGEVIRIDPLTHGSVLEAFRRCAFAVVPSLWPEPSGLAALEAMAMAKPVIATRTGGLPEIVVHGKTGLLVGRGDVADLHRALALLVADPGLRTRFGTAGRQRVARYFSANAVVPRFEQLYATMVGRPQA